MNEGLICRHKQLTAFNLLAVGHQIEQKKLNKN